ncbi:chemotaxis protein CheX [Sulfurimonas sp. MAG313]|nr:chemotaxis protein CheX [Sulfurimonas sp. MAG313]MDF1880008.1 chemotaxis protein CheX [Sulfurimonas sp. MAG313]
MLSIIIQAAENFLHNQIDLKTEKSTDINTFSKMRTVIASIDVKMDDGETKTIYLGFNETLIKEIISVYLMEDDADDATMQDMVLESTNMIVGSAKVLAEEAEKEHFMITTPEFKAIEEFDNCICSEISILSTSKDSLVIGIKG